MLKIAEPDDDRIGHPQPEQFVSALGIKQPVDVESGIDFYDEVSRFEIFLILRALKHTGGCQSRAAKLLNLRPTTLNSKIKAYNLNWRALVQSAFRLAAKLSGCAGRLFPASAGEHGRE